MKTYGKSNDYKGLINNLRDEYNKHIENLPSYEGLVESLKEEKQKAYLETAKENFLRKAQGILDSVQKDSGEILKEKMKVSYPLFSDPSTSLQGTLEINNALLLLTGRSQPAEYFLNILNDAIIQDRIDFATTIFQKLAYSSSDKSELRTSVLSLYDSFKENIGLAEIETELNDYENLLNRIDHFIAKVNEQDNFIFFPEDYRKMDAEEKMKVDNYMKNLPFEERVKLKNLMYQEVM